MQPTSWLQTPVSRCVTSVFMHWVPARLPVLVVTDARLHVSSNVLQQDHPKVLTPYPKIPTGFDHWGATTSLIKPDELPGLTLTHKCGLESGLFRVQHPLLVTDNSNYAINFPIATEDNRGKHKFLILVRMPAESWRNILTGTREMESPFVAEEVKESIAPLWTILMLNKKHVIVLNGHCQSGIEIS